MSGQTPRRETQHVNLRVDIDAARLAFKAMQSRRDEGLATDDDVYRTQVELARVNDALAIAQGKSSLHASVVARPTREPTTG